MDRKMPVAGDFYRHFKGGLYQVKAIAVDSADLKSMVVYQAMYVPFQLWVRPLDEFLSKTDRERYPDAEEYRFTLVTPEGEVLDENQPQGRLQDDEENIQEEQVNEEIEEDSQNNVNQNEDDRQYVEDEEFVSALLSGQLEKRLDGRVSDQEIADRGFLYLLDANSCHEKRQILVALKPYLDKRILGNIAVSMDLVLEEGDEQSYYDAILHCLQTMEKYEGGHLRR